MVRAERERRRIGGDPAHPITRIVAGERLHDFDFGVAWKIFRVGQIDRAASGIDFELTLLRLLERLGHAMRVAEEEFRGVHEHAALVLETDYKSTEDGLRE